jgi:hypothetical protein
MKKLLLILLLLIALPIVASQNEPIKDCKCKEKKLYGRVKFVDAAEDFRVKIVTGGEHLKVRKINYTALYCGEWRIVDGCEDFRVKIVTGGEDFRVRFVDYTPY